MIVRVAARRRRCGSWRRPGVRVGVAVAPVDDVAGDRVGPRIGHRAEGQTVRRALVHARRPLIAIDGATLRDRDCERGGVRLCACVVLDTDLDRGEPTGPSAKKHWKVPVFGDAVYRRRAADDGAARSAGRKARDESEGVLCVRVGDESEVVGPGFPLVRRYRRVHHNRGRGGVRSVVVRDRADPRSVTDVHPGTAGRCGIGKRDGERLVGLERRIAADRDVDRLRLVSAAALRESEDPASSRCNPRPDRRYRSLP